MQEQCWISAAVLSWVLLAVTVNFTVAEQVIVPNGAVTFPAGEASPTTTIVVSFAEPVQLAGGHASFRIALWSRAEVLCGKNTVIPKGLQIGHNDCPNAGLDKLRAYMNGNIGFILATNCSVDDIREVFANNRRMVKGARVGQIFNVDLGLPSGLAGMDPSQTSFFQLLSIGMKMVVPGASEIVLDLATVALVDGASVLIFSVIFQEVDTFHLAFDTEAFTSTPPVVLPWAAQQFSTLLPQTRKNRSRTSCFLTSVPRVFFSATLRSTLMKESWRLPTGARWSESRRAAWRWPFLLDKVTGACTWIKCVRDLPTDLI